jgi:P-type E1-E2 ATPase
VVFDKTGTITRGRPEVAGFACAEGLDQKAVLSAALSIENHSSHPLAEAVARYCTGRGARALVTAGFASLEGAGLKADVGGDKVFVGRREYLSENGIAVPPELERAEKEFSGLARTLAWCAINGKAAGLFGLSDAVKENAREVVSYLKASGKEVYLVTGDSEGAAKQAAAEAGIENVAFGVLPAGKAAFIKELRSKGRSVAMVGDGINDAPALASADLGIALGSGIDIAQESAGILLIKNDLMDVRRTIELSRLTMGKIRQNLFWAFAYNVLGIPIAAGALYHLTGFLLNPMIAGFAMALSSFSVVTNSLSIRRYNKSRLPAASGA